MEAEFLVRDDGPLPGLADFIPEGRELSDSELYEIASSIEAAGLPMQVVLGPREAWAAFLRSFSRRTLLRELPPVEGTLPWLEAHVPPGGETAVRVGSSLSAERELSVNIFGSGGGRARRVTLTASSESEPRSGCVSYAMRFLLRPRIFSRGGAESIEIAVLNEGTLVIEMRSRSECPWCGVLGGVFDESRFQLAPSVDLRLDKGSLTVKRTIDVDITDSIEAGFNIPAITGQLKLTAKVAKAATIEFQTRLAAGAIYREFWYLGDEGARHGPLWTADPLEGGR